MGPVFVGGLAYIRWYHYDCDGSNPWDEPVLGLTLFHMFSAIMALPTSPLMIKIFLETFLGLPLIWAPPIFYSTT
jgi:hypothetical protein